jgi:hypothetical protein
VALHRAGGHLTLDGQAASGLGSQHPEGRDVRGRSRPPA